MPQLRSELAARGWVWLAIASAAVMLSCDEKRDQRPTDWDGFLDETVIANVGDQALTARELDHILALRFSNLIEGYGVETERSIRDVLKVELEHRILAMEAERVGFVDTSRTVEALLRWARQNVIQSRFTQDVIFREAEPTEDEIRAQYDAALETYRVQRRSAIAHILVATRAEAEAALARVRSGEPFSDVVSDVTLDDVNDFTGRVGWVEEEQPIRGFGVLPGFNEPALEMETDEYRIIETEKGWHVLHCIRRDEAGYRPYEDVRESILTSLRRRRQSVNLDLRLREFRARYGTRVNDENLAAYLAWRRSEPESALWVRAQAETDPARKIEIYEEYVETFPHSDHACEAKFMVGFTLAEEIGDRNRARLALRDFIVECPESPLVQSAQFMMQELSSVKR